MVQFLHKNGADIDKANKSGDTALHLAAARGHLDTVLSLLNNGAEVNIQNENERTALERASLNKHSEIVDALLKKGGKIIAPSNLIVCGARIEHSDTDQSQPQKPLLNAYEQHTSKIVRKNSQHESQQDSQQYQSLNKRKI